MRNFLRRLTKKQAKSIEDCLSENGLPFSSLEEAEKFFFAERDKDLKEIAELGTKFPELDLDLKATSLDRLEKFYFKCYADKSIAINLPKERMETLITQYMRQVFVVNGMAEWAVFENDFAEGYYEAGLMYGYGSGTTEHYAGALDQRKDNVGRNRLFSSFMLYVPKENEKDVL